MKNIFSALANTNRLRMVRILLRGPLNVSEISDVLGLSQSNVSHNLRTLLDAGIVVRRGRGGWVYYSLNRYEPAVQPLIESISDGVKRIDNYDNDIAELTRCYNFRRMESKEFFDRVASEIDQVSYLMPDPDEYIDKVLDMYPPSSIVIDAGCGSGDLVLKLARRGNSVIGVDQSQEMLSKAGRKLNSCYFNKSAELRLGNAEHLPVADSSVDGVIAHMLLHHLGEPYEFFSEAARVCSDLGRCTVIELQPHENSNLKRMQGDLWPGLDVLEVRRWMKLAGFRNVEEISTDDERIFILSGVLDGRVSNG